MNNNLGTSVPVELLRKYDKAGPRYTSYPTAPIWSDKIGGSEYIEDLKVASQKDDLIAVYCHIPYCKTRCYYCGCNTFITNNPNNAETYIDCLCKEIENTARYLAPRNKVSQLHFGGGTPTYIGINGLGRVLDCYDKYFEFVKGSEKSIEVDPRVTTQEQIEYLTSRGFNRISFGVQDFETEVQEASGRVQSFESVVSLLEHCRSLNFKGINFDLIYGLPKQTVESFRRTIKKAIDLRPDRLAVYSFAYLPEMRANQTKIKEEDLPATEVKYGLFASAVEMFTAAGYRQIGMDHFALPDDELSRALTDGRLHRNFMGYTVQAAEDMIGIGMSSIGYVNNAFFQNISKINSYKEAVNTNEFSIYRGMRLTKDDLIRQYIIKMLMCNFKLSYQTVKDKFGVEYKEYFADEHPDLNGFVDDGFMKIHDDRLEITPLGRTFVRNIAMTFDAYLKSDKKTAFSRTI